MSEFKSSNLTCCECNYKYPQIAALNYSEDVSKSRYNFIRRTCRNCKKIIGITINYKGELVTILESDANKMKQELYYRNKVGEKF